MKYIIILLLLLVNTIFASDLSEILNNAERNIFRIVVPISGNKHSTGTCFVINKDGYIITNNHVVEDRKNKIFIKNKWKEYRDITLIKTYPKKDIAIFKIEEYKTNSFLKLQKPTTIIKALEAFSAGFPGGADLMVDNISYDSTIQNGYIQSIDLSNSSTFPSGYKLLRISVAVNSGDSGGPLISNQSTVMGINTIKNSAVESISWSIHIEELIKILKEEGIEYDISTADITEKKNNNKTIWIAIGFISFLLISILIYIIKSNQRKYTRKDNNPKENNKGEVLNINPSNKTRVINIKLVSSNLSLPEISFYKSFITIGRSSESDIIISHHHISKKHLTITKKGSIVEIVDLESSNGTYINNNRLEAHKKYILRSKQQLMIGNKEIIYQIQKD